MIKNIKDYLISIYGKPSREASYITSSRQEILIYKWSETDEGVSMYVTEGASKIFKNSIGDSCEFFIIITRS